jgi:pimeloyl-ACP methyl ester carboxylesterase
MQTDRNIYCISGLGTDEQVFRNISLPGTRFVHLQWLNHEPKESLAAYSNRMAAQISEPDPIIIGLSFGGMIAIEIARQQSVKKLIIISGVKTSRELPRWMRVAGKWQMHKWLPVRSNVLTERYDNRMLGITTEEEKKIANAYRKSLDKKFQAWAIDHILTWKNEWYPDGTVHIHGDKDKMFPIRNINASHVVRNGTHMMIYNKAEVIVDYIRNCEGLI